MPSKYENTDDVRAVAAEMLGGHIATTADICLWVDGSALIALDAAERWQAWLLDTGWEPLAVVGLPNVACVTVWTAEWDSRLDEAEGRERLEEAMAEPHGLVYTLDGGLAS
jgi:hypothetical protein